MSRRTRRRERAGGLRAAISMDSLIDLTFLLLVTFMVTLPVLEQGITVMLPQAKTDELPTKDSKANTITVEYEGRITLNGNATSLSALEEEVRKMVAADPDVPVLVRGDKRLAYGTVMDVVKVLYKCQVHKMALVTEAE